MMMRNHAGWISLAVLCASAAAWAGPIHSADQNGDRSVSLSELLRTIQLFNAKGYHCDDAGEDGFAPGVTEEHACAAHDADYAPQDWHLSLSELLRMIQLFNSTGYFRSRDTEDGFAPDYGVSAKPGWAKHFTPYIDAAAPNAPGYDLPLNLSSIANYGDLAPRLGLQTVADLLETNGFAVREGGLALLGRKGAEQDDIVAPYTYFGEAEIPIFVTSDLLLHLFHIQFDETLKDIEEREFIGDITALTSSLLEALLAEYDAFSGDLQEAARRNIAYLSVAQRLLSPSSTVEAIVTDEVAAELTAIDAHAGVSPSAVFVYAEDYSQYVPRGHYTRSEALEKYFKAMMWYGRMAFLMKGDNDWDTSGQALVSVEDARIQTIQAVLLAQAINGVMVGERSGREVWDRMYTVTSFYVGVSDDLTPYEYLEVIQRLFGDAFTPGTLEDPEAYFALKAELALLRSPQIYGGTGNAVVIPPVTDETLDETLEKTKGMRLMGQRFIPDSYMFQHLVFPEVKDYLGGGAPLPFSCGDTGARLARCFPRGLDVMALLGSGLAYDLLEAGGDTAYVNFDKRYAELEDFVTGLDIQDWYQNLYWGWLYALRSLLTEAPEGYPNFVRTEAWRKKSLNAALASWTELRHDTILYAKQSYTEGEVDIPGIPPGYVEPNPEFFGRLLALARMTRSGLDEMAALSENAGRRLDYLESLLERLLAIAVKEVQNEALAEADREFLMHFGPALQWAVLGVSEAGTKTTLVADVHTHGAEQRVVEEGVGNVDLIFVACPTPEGSVFLAVGAGLSYYEFKHPMNDRLTDEAWRTLLDSEERPERPEWFAPLVR